MKANKTLLIVTTAFMYVCHLPLYTMFVLAFANIPANSDLQNTIMKNLFGTFLGLNALIFPLVIVIGVFSIISVFKGNESPTKTTMVCKLVLIPWFIINFAMCVVLLAGLLNPFFMFAIPVLIPVMICTTYVYMLATSLPDIAWAIHSLIKSEPINKGLLITSMVLQFFFCLDIAGAIMHYVTERNMNR